MHGVISRARRHREALAVLMVDLNRFKPVNHRHGHMVGDLVQNGQGYLFGRPGLARDVAPLAALASADAWTLVT
ncbi:MAG: diguanylate cyclase [Rubrivivax sp.]|nr:diguanylate cyclase [Rubrivivax sp.]